MLYNMDIPTDMEIHKPMQWDTHKETPPEKQAVEQNLPCSHRKTPTCTL